MNIIHPRRERLVLGLLLLCILGLFAVSFFVGSYELTFADIQSVLFGKDASKEATTILLHNRLPRTLMALMAGAGLALAGLLMQTMFRNELAGPSVLGISSGASLGVGLVVLAGWSTGPLAHVSVAVLGSLAILLLMLAVVRVFRDSGSLLVFGLMTAYICGAFLTVLQAGAAGARLKVFVQWGLGSFAPLTGSEWQWTTAALGLAVVMILPLSRWFDVLLLGGSHPASLGAPVRKIQFFMLLAAGIITGCVTAFCGPIAFLGLAVPHLARGLWRSSEHRLVLPTTVLLGGVLGLGCDILVRLEPFGMILPLNAVTSLIGAPVVIRVILKNARMTSLM
jgi:iron complex transport system permease protein